jgi:hypothetical protein
MASELWRWVLTNMALSMTCARQGGASDIFPHWALFLNVSRRERAGYRKEMSLCFLPAFFLAYSASLKSHGEPERPGIICLDFHCFVLLFEHVNLTRVDDLDDGTT